MSQRATFDCHEAIAIAYPGVGKGMRGKVHLMQVPRAGVALHQGIHIEGEVALRQLLAAVEHALSIAPRPPAGHPFPVVQVDKP